MLNSNFTVNIQFLLLFSSIFSFFSDNRAIFSFYLSSKLDIWRRWCFLCYFIISPKGQINGTEIASTNLTWYKEVSNSFTIRNKFYQIEIKIDIRCSCLDVYDYSKDTQASMIVISTDTDLYFKFQNGDTNSPSLIGQLGFVRVGHSVI